MLQQAVVAASQQDETRLQAASRAFFCQDLHHHTSSRPQRHAQALLSLFATCTLPAPDATIAGIYLSAGLLSDCPAGLPRDAVFWSSLASRSSKGLWTAVYLLPHRKTREAVSTVTGQVTHRAIDPAQRREQILATWVKLALRFSSIFLSSTHHWAIFIIRSNLIGTPVLHPGVPCIRSRSGSISPTGPFSPLSHSQKTVYCQRDPRGHWDRACRGLSTYRLNVSRSRLAVKLPGQEGKGEACLAWLAFSQ